MKRKILLPTDFSKNAWHAINYALELYKNDQCHFYILNVFSGKGDIMSSLIHMDPGSEMYEIAKLDSENGLAKVLDMLTFRDYDIELIVMGTKGSTSSKLKTFGGVAIAVMEKVRNCPVLVVPEQAKHNLPKEIVFPNSLKTHLKRRELNYLIDLAKNCNASIKVLHVATEDNLNEKQLSNQALLEEYFANVSHSFHFLSRTEIAGAIKCFVESRESHMVAFINKKHAFFGSILTHPLVKEIGQDSKVPLLVMHDLRN
jgi:hypothetical protein